MDTLHQWQFGRMVTMPRVSHGHWPQCHGCRTKRTQIHNGHTGDMAAAVIFSLAINFNNTKRQMMDPVFQVALFNVES